MSKYDEESLTTSNTFSENYNIFRRITTRTKMTCFSKVWENSTGATPGAAYYN